MWVRAAALIIVFLPVCPAGVLPVVTLDKTTSEAFDRYVATYEQGPDARFRESRTLILDSQPKAKQKDVASGKLLVLILKGENMDNGNIHHLYGAMHISGVTAAQVRRAMQDYAKYSVVYKPDVAESSGELLPGGEPADEHFRVKLKFVQSTLWLDVAFDTVYDTHYLRLDDHSFQTMSRSISIREYKDAHNPSLGTYEDGDGHGFLWRIDTSWHAVDRGDGVDLEITNITLTRPVPFGFGWWASRKARASIENLMRRTREAIVAANHGPRNESDPAVR